MLRPDEHGDDHAAPDLGSCSLLLKIMHALHERRQRPPRDGDDFYSPFREFFLLHFDPTEAQTVRWAGTAIFLEVDGDGIFDYLDTVEAALKDLRYAAVLLSDAPGPDDIEKREVEVASVARRTASELGRLADELEAALLRSKRRKR